jgi:hypothetical protein
MIKGAVSAKYLGVTATLLRVLVGLLAVGPSYFELQRDQSLYCVTATDDVPINAPVKDSVESSHVTLFPPQLWCEMPGYANSQFLAVEHNRVWLCVAPAGALIVGGLFALVGAGTNRQGPRDV